MENVATKFLSASFLHRAGSAAEHHREGLCSSDRVVQQALAEQSVKTENYVSLHLGIAGILQSYYCYTEFRLLSLFLVKPLANAKDIVQLKTVFNDLVIFCKKCTEHFINQILFIIFALRTSFF